MINGVISLAIDQRITINNIDNKHNGVSTLPVEQKQLQFNVAPYGSTQLMTMTNNITSPNPIVQYPNTNGILHEPVHDKESGWDCVYSKYWAPAHAQMNIKVE